MKEARFLLGHTYIHRAMNIQLPTLRCQLDVRGEGGLTFAFPPPPGRDLF
jgi:hypothetical protein